MAKNIKIIPANGEFLFTGDTSESTAIFVDTTELIFSGTTNSVNMSAGYFNQQYLLRGDLNLKIDTSIYDENGNELVDNSGNWKGFPYYDKGFDGSKGDKGIKGLKGSTNTTGTKGNKGLKGTKSSTSTDKGELGPTGDKGIEGLKGTKGLKGEIGPIGETGVIADKGQLGPIGSSGDNGPIGNVFAEPDGIYSYGSLVVNPPVIAAPLTEPVTLYKNGSFLQTLTSATTISSLTTGDILSSDTPFSLGIDRVGAMLDVRYRGDEFGFRVDRYTGDFYVLGFNSGITVTLYIRDNTTSIVTTTAQTITNVYDYVVFPISQGSFNYIIRADYGQISVFRDGDGDVLPIPPASKELYGVPSLNGDIVSLYNANNGSYVTSNEESDSYSELQELESTLIANTSQASQYTGPAYKITFDYPVFAISQGDGDGGEATPFVSKNLMFNQWRIPLTTTTVDFVVFVGYTEGSEIKRYNSSGVLQSTYYTSGADPTVLRVTGASAGDLFIADSPQWAIFEDTSGNNETLLIGGYYGQPGEKGTKGTKGIKGTKGEKGVGLSKGLKGDKGEKGLIGPSESDERLKTGIKTISNALNSLMNIDVKEYDWNEKYSYYNELSEKQKLHSIGMVAQSVQKIFPEVVFRRNDGYYGIHYSKLNAIIVEAIKERQVEIDNMVDEINWLKSQVK